VGGEHHAPATLPPGKTRYSLYIRLSDPQVRSGRVRKISPPTGIRSPDCPARRQLQPANNYSARNSHKKTASVVPPEDGCLTPETCSVLRHNKVIVKVKVYKVGYVIVIIVFISEQMFPVMLNVCFSVSFYKPNKFSNKQIQFIDKQFLYSTAHYALPN
jgi:hypothetical protein